VVYALAAAGVTGLTLVGGWPVALGCTFILIGLFVFSAWAAWLWTALLALVAFSVELGLPGTGVRLVFPTEVLIPVLLIAAAIRVFVRGRFRWIQTPLNPAAAFFVLAMVLTLVPSSDKSVTLKAIVRDVSYLIAGYLLIRQFLTTPRRLKILLIVRAFVTTLIAAYGLYTQFSEGVRYYQQIAAPFFDEYAVYAALLAMDFAVLCSFVLEYRRSPWRWAGIGLLGFWGFAIALTFSRGAWLSLGAMGVFYLWLHRKSIDLKVTTGLIMIMVLGVGIVAALGVDQLFVLRMEHLTDLDFLTNYDRIDRWMAALAIFADHPVLGVGWNRYADEYSRYVYYLDAYSIKIRMGAHNLYLEMMAESGGVGITAFLVMLGVYAGESLKLLGRCKDRFLEAALAGFLGAMITFLVHAFVNNLGPSDKISLSFWFLIGVTPMIGKMLMDKERKMEEPMSGGGDGNARTDC